MSKTKVDLIDAVPPLYRQIQCEERPSYRYSLHGRIETGPERTKEARLAIATLTHLVWAAEQAKEMSTLAISHREYKVGATAVMANFETGMLGYLKGCNVKPRPGKVGENIHAEQMALAKGRSANLVRAAGICVYANPDDEDANPNKLPTLPPCGRCTDMFVDCPEVDDTTLVLGTNLDHSVCELYTVGALTGKHKRLVKDTFSLQTEADLDAYDHEIRPYLTLPIYQMFGQMP